MRMDDSEWQIKPRRKPNATLLIITLNEPPPSPSPSTSPHGTHDDHDDEVNVQNLGSTVNPQIVKQLIGEDEALKVFPQSSTTRPVAVVATTAAAKTTTPRPQTPKSKRPALAAADAVGWPDELHKITTAKPYLASRDCGVRPHITLSSPTSSTGSGNSTRRSLGARVVGGRDSEFGELPWTVLIRESSLLGLFFKTKCGGVLIDLKWVLTAAHCQPGVFGSLVVVVGEYNLASNGHQQRGKLMPSLRRVKRMIVHRDYNHNNFDNDIALLELETPFQLEPHVVPICLPEKDEEFGDKQALVAGWGKLSFGARDLPNVLQVAKLPVISNKKCQEMYHQSGHIKIISDSFLCAGYKDGGRDSCDGDSGSPLQVQRSDGRWALIGTVSHGIKCAEPNLPGIYIRTAAYLPWIKAVIYHQDTNKRYGPTFQRNRS